MFTNGFGISWQLMEFLTLMFNSLCSIRTCFRLMIIGRLRFYLKAPMLFHLTLTALFLFTILQLFLLGDILI